MNRSHKIIIILAVALVASLFLNYKQYRDSLEQPTEKVEIRTETKVETKEEKRKEPEPVKSEVTKKISVKKKKKKTPDSELAEKKEEIPDSISEIITETDSTYEVPITQKVYEDSLYTAWVSGFRCSLDSITLRNKTVTNFVYETRTKTKTKLITFGVQTGMYLTPKGFQPGIGFGVTLNIK